MSIKPGDIVHFRKPFKPELCSFREYTFGVVVGVVTDKSTITPQLLLTPQYSESVNELVVHLFEPSTSTTYVDQFGVKALFSFGRHEVELCKSAETVAHK